MWSAALLLLCAVSHVMLQCDNGDSFRAHCNGVRRRICTFNNNNNIIIDLLYNYGTRATQRHGSQEREPLALYT